MDHPIYRVVKFEKLDKYKLKIVFDDNTIQEIDFLPVLMGEIYGQLQDEKLFDQVTIDPEVHTLVWSNGADYDPLTLHDWSKYAEAMKKMAQNWSKSKAKIIA